jgi:hypothetical protein
VRRHPRRPAPPSSAPSSIPHLDAIRQAPPSAGPSAFRRAPPFAARPCNIVVRSYTLTQSAKRHHPPRRLRLSHAPPPSTELPSPLSRAAAVHRAIHHRLPPAPPLSPPSRAPAVSSTIPCPRHSISPAAEARIQCHQHHRPPPFRAAASPPLFISW